MRTVPHKMTIPNNCLNILTAIRDSDNEAFLVGGCVRDSYMGNVPKDYDICTNLLPEKVIELFSGKDYVENLDLTGKSFGVVRIKTTDGEYEVATYRSETYDGKVRQPQTVEFKTDVKDDLSRRDFTINAMIYDFFKQEIRDYFGGLDDIAAKIIRCVGNAEERFAEDPLRTLRAIRFFIKLKFVTFQEDTSLAMERTSIINLPKERVVEEIRKILSIKNDNSLVYSLYFLRKYLIIKEFFGLTDQEWYIPDSATKKVYTEPIINFLLNIVFTYIQNSNKPKNLKFSLLNVKKFLSDLKFSNEEINKTYLFLKLKCFLFHKENIVENVYKYKKEVHRLYGSDPEELESFCRTITEINWFLSNEHPRWTRRFCYYISLPFVKADKYAAEEGLSGIEIGKKLALDEQVIWRETRNQV